MKLYSAILAAIMLIVGLASMSMASVEEYSEQACAKVDQRMRILKQNGSTSSLIFQAVDRRDVEIANRTKAINAERWSLNCSNDARLTRGNFQRCQQLNQEYRRLQSKLAANKEEFARARNDLSRDNAEIAQLGPLQRRRKAMSQHRRSGFTELGCFADNRQSDPRGLRGRIMSRGMIADDPAMTPRKCIVYCAGQGADFAGLQYGKWCFCGSEGYDAVGPSNACTMACSGDYSQNCGGAWANRVLSTRMAY